MAFLDQSGPVTAAQDHPPPSPPIAAPPPTQSRLPPPQSPPTSRTAALYQGLGVGLPSSFGQDIGTVASAIGGVPVSAYQQFSQAEGDVLRAQQEQAKAKAEATDRAYNSYGSTAEQALHRYNAEMANAPLPAFVPTKETASDLGALGAMVMMLGFMVGKGKGMQPGLAALDSMTGMLRGWSQGRKDLYDREEKSFKLNFERLREAHEQYAQELQNALDVSTVDLRKGLADANLAAVKAGDAVTAAQIKAQGIKGVIDAVNAQISIRAGAAKIVSSFEEKQQERAAQNSPLDDRTATVIAEATYKGDPQPLQSAVGFSRNRSQLLSQIFEKIHDLHPDFSGEKLAAAQAQFGGVKAGAVAAGRVGGVVAVGANELKRMVPLVRETAAKISRTNYPSINAIELAVAKGTGDPNVVQLNSYIQSIKNAYSLVTSRGGRISDQVRKYSDEIIIGSLAPSQLDAALNAVVNEANVVGTAAHDALGETTGQPSLSSVGSGAPELTEQEYNTAPSGTRYRVPGNPTIMVKP